MAQGTGYDCNCFTQRPLTGITDASIPENVRYNLFMYRMLALLHQYSDIYIPAHGHCVRRRGRLDLASPFFPHPFIELIAAKWFLVRFLLKIWWVLWLDMDCTSVRHSNSFVLWRVWLWLTNKASPILMKRPTQTVTSAALSNLHLGIVPPCPEHGGMTRRRGAKLLSKPQRI